MHFLGLSEEVGDECEMGILKKALKTKGVNQRGWRLYVDYGDHIITPVLRPVTSQNIQKGGAIQAIEWLRVLQACEMDVPPPLKLSQSVAKWPLPGSTTASIPPLFLRAIWKVVLCKEYQKEDVQTFLKEDVMLVVTWYFSDGGKEKVNDAQLKVGWNAIWRVYEEDLQLHQNADKSSWENWVNLVEYDGYVFKALNSPFALHQEGEAMQHCIADYLHDCRAGEYRVFGVSMKRTGERLATMTVVLNSRGRWEAAEIFGPENEDVSDRLMQSTDAVCRSLNDLYRINSLVRSSMNKHMKRSVKAE